MHNQRARLHLPQPARQVLAELELVSHGSTQAWNSSGQHGESQAVLPHGESRPPHLHWRAQFEAATPEQIPALVRQAREELDALTKSKPTTASTDIDAVVIEDGEGWEPEPVGHRYGLTAAHVRRIRTRADRDPETGQVTTDAGTTSVTPAERRVRARELHAKGLTLRQIAMHLRVHHTTVLADLKATA